MHLGSASTEIPFLWVCCILMTALACFAPAPLAASEAESLPPQNAKEKPPAEKEIDSWVAQLGDEEPARRDEAEHKLAAAGTAAVRPLREAEKSTDAEVRTRAARLLVEIVDKPLCAKLAMAYSANVSHTQRQRCDVIDSDDAWSKFVAEAPEQHREKLRALGIDFKTERAVAIVTGGSVEKESLRLVPDPKEWVLHFTEAVSGGRQSQDLLVARFPRADKPVRAERHSKPSF